jgi:5-oxoprolinase (ATP-hydrolysing)/N-methylhydantoinase A
MTSFDVGVDIGGTFTDFVLRDANGTLHSHKCVTTVGDPSVGVMSGLRDLLGAASLPLADGRRIVHGTTLVTNAVVERKGAATGLLMTAGFRDVLGMRREQRYDIHDLFSKYPEPLVPRRWCRDVNERIDRSGRVVTPLDPDEVVTIADELVRDGVEALAVVFLHSYRDPTHERVAAQAIRTAFPDLALSISSEIASEVREYERASTTVCNAYTLPLARAYLERLAAQIVDAGFRGSLLLMQSSGGLTDPESVRPIPVRLLESGPAGGALMASVVARNLSVNDLLAFDMGGTTAKACLVEDGRLARVDEIEVDRVDRFKPGSGLTVRTPVVDMMEIGAGGGSIAHVDELGRLRVGPQSAGASPGPACYALGGSDATVTDACLALGYLSERGLLGGQMPLDYAAAARAFDELGRVSRLDGRTAWSVYAVVCNNMAELLRAHAIERGRDPRAQPILAYGGAGPLHAVHVARILRAPEVIVPAYSGVASALGFLATPIAFDFARSLPSLLVEVDWTTVNAVFAELEERARDALERSGADSAAIAVTRSVNMRLGQQSHHLEVPVPAGSLDAATAALLDSAFRAEYTRRYHAIFEGDEPVVLTWKLRAEGPQPELQIDVTRRSAEGRPRVPRTRPAYFGEADGFVATLVLARDELQAGRSYEGPLIVEDDESTTVVGPHDLMRVDELGNLRLAIGAMSQT